MSPTIMWIFSFVMLLGLGCAHKARPPQSPAKKVLTDKVYEESYPATSERVWRALMLTLTYPLQQSLQEEGYLETEWVDQTEGFWPVHQKGPQLDIQYKILARLRTIRISGGKVATRLSVEKKVRTRPNFFDQFREIISDGIEEQLILYRVGRELEIENLIKKAALSSSGKKN